MKFNEEQIKKLEENPNVLQVLDNKIFYTPEFKAKAIQDYEQGKSAKQIFIDAGFNLSEISTISDYASRIAGRVDFSLPKKNSVWLTKVNQTIECKSMQNWCNFVQD